jgi:hypothetical protein
MVAAAMPALFSWTPVCRTLFAGALFAGRLSPHQ